MLNYGNLEELRKEYYQAETKQNLSQEQKKELNEYRKSLKELGKSNNLEEFLESSYREIYEEEAEELEELEREKGNLSENEQGISYDLGRPDLAVLWRKQLYFITGFEYINNWKLTVSIRARKCPLSLYYWNWMRGAGMGIIEKGPVITDTNQRMHYDFCGDLSIKATYEQAFEYQPRFVLFQARNAGALTFSRGTDGSGMNIPTDVTLDV